MFRNWVFKALCQVVQEGVYSNLYLKDHLDEVDPKNRALATRIFYGTIQNYTLCEYVWKKYVTKKVPKKINILLTMSVYQMLFLDKVPVYAVVNDAVKIARVVNPSLAGLVNAVLHKVQQNPIELPEHTLEKIAVRYSVPEWLIRMWQAQYGLEKAQQMAKLSNQAMPVIVRANPLQSNETDFENNPDFVLLKKPLYIYKGSQSLPEHPFYKQGKISAQDEGSYDIAALASPKPQDKVLDVCAAPGTKTMAMAEMMQNTGSILALDVHEHRTRLIANDARRLHLKNVQAKTQDSTDLSEIDELFDVVLCDVPCSGYGVLARKPDLKLRMKSSDMDTLIPLQRKLFEQAANHVVPGGRLVYSTCTINKKENEKQVEFFLQNHPEFELIKEETIFPDVQKDGFYMAALKKKENEQAI
jgi:16S rRNA (cytosine967-C5)-methyltransferase